MATKAELEAEVLRLRAELERQPARDLKEEEPALEPEEDTEHESWEDSLSDIVTALEDLPQKQPVMLALGALAVGYLIGRAR